MDVEEHTDALDASGSEVPFEGVEETAAEETEAVSLSPEVLARAQEYGLGADDVQGFDAPRLERMFAGIDRRIMGQSAPAPESTVAPQQSQQQAAVEFKPFALELTDDIDESVSAPIKTMVEHLNSQMKEIHEFRQQALAEMNAINTLRNIEAFDRHLQSFGDGFEDEYGKGSTLDLDPQSKQFQNRLKIYNGGNDLLENATKRGEAMRGGEGWLRSHRAMHWDRITELARKQVGEKIDKRKSQFGERPTKGKAPAMSPREEALAALTR